MMHSAASTAKSILDRANDIAAGAWKRASTVDADGAFPDEDIAALSQSGLLRSPFPTDMGGEGIGIGDPETTRPVLVALGKGSLSLGRLYEGHLNAVALTRRYGTPANLALLMDEAMEGRPSGVWMAGEPLSIENGSISGRKLLCSGAGHFRRPLVAADTAQGSVMLIPYVDGADRIDLSAWVVQGMRGTATGTVDFNGISVRNDEIVGNPGDYLRSPFFKGGAWRVIAVQLGGVEAILEHMKHQLAASPHSDHPLQLSRLGRAEIACETARLWVERAAVTAEQPYKNEMAVDAYVDLARNAFEVVALEIVELAQKTIGLKTFLRQNPIERVARDLLTYLRQPALDMSLISAAAFHLRQQ